MRSGLLFTLLVLFNSPALAQMTDRKVAGFAVCQKCHDQNRQPRELPGGQVLGGASDWILSTECGIWLNNDKHVQAYAVLHNELSKRMGRLLNSREIYRDVRCLACHSGYPVEQMEVEAGLCSEDMLTKIDVNLGVACEGCHGASENTTETTNGWLDDHYKSYWRYLSPKRKLEEYGYVDVRSPTARAKMCVSCHIGDVRSGRVITHEMYAAGHPPLPAFEIESFVNQMPRHWRYLKEKDEKLVADFLEKTADPLFERTSPAINRESMNRTRSMLAGAVVAYGQNLRLTADLANSKAPFPTQIKKPQWPDLTRFDCYACHHELRYPGWRQTRGYQTAPGRPTLHQWPVALVRFMAGINDEQTTLDVHLNALNDALSARPLGDTERLVTACEQAAVWADEFALRLERLPLTLVHAQELRRKLVDFCSSTTLDYDSARQMLWAFLVIDQEVRSSMNEAVGFSDPATMLVQNAELMRTYQKDFLVLELRAGQSADLQISTERKPRSILTVELQNTLPKIDGYDPVKFQRQFTEIKQTVSQ